MRTAGPQLRRIFDSSRAPGPDVAGRLPGIFEDHDLAGPEGDALQEMARPVRQTALVAVGLVQPHSRDLSTAISGHGSKPCSTSQRTARRLRSDHHARITSRSTSVP
jgi:hypothetical protein